MRPRITGSLALALALALWPVAPGDAAPQTQEIQDRVSQQSRDPREPGPNVPAFHSVPLKYSKASEMARVLSEMYGSTTTSPTGGFVRNPPTRVRIVGDDRTNMLLIQASPGDLETIKKLLAALDVEARPVKQQLRVFRLQRTDSATAERLFKSLLGGTSVRVSVDPATNSVIASGDADALDTVEALLHRLDEDASRPGDKAESREYQVRIVWLATGLKREDAARPPDDLKEVVAELAKLGVTEPKMVAQTILNAQPASPFQSQGTAVLESACDFRVVGSIKSQSGEAPRLQIQLEATVAGAPRMSRGGFGSGPGGDRGGFQPPGGSAGPGAVCQLQTEITAPAGHSVVLGVTPTGTSTSIFVVQVTPKKTTARTR